MKTKTLSLAFLSFCIISLASCAAYHKGAVTEESIPADIAKYKVLYTEIDFKNTASKNTIKVHNRAAKKHVIKKTGHPEVFIKPEDLDKTEYSDLDTYRYVLVNKISGTVVKQQYRTDPRTGMKTPTGGQTEVPLFEFYFFDRKELKELPHMKGSTMPLFLLKAIVNKVSAEPATASVAHKG